MSNLTGKTVLIVDDYPLNIELHTIFAQQAGAETLTAENGVQCLEIINKHPVDFILMDINMPEMDGLETTRNIRSLPNCNKIIIIGVTGYDDKDQISMCIESGMNTVISKLLLTPEKLIEIADIYFKESESGPTINEPDTAANDIFNFDKSAVFNYEQALKEFDSDKELLQELLRKFTKILDSQIVRICQLFQENCLNDIANEAHAIKGGAANICAFALSESAANLESYCRQKKSFALIETEINNLKNQITVFENEITRISNSSFS